MTFPEPTPFAEFFDYAAVINLPSRPDRLKSIRKEVQLLGISPDALDVPEAPIPDTDGGFPSAGVYGNFLSHLAILKRARDINARHVLVLEDDAIFVRRVRDPGKQKAILEAVQSHDWATWNLGHRLKGDNRPAERGVVPTRQPFTWAHAYCVNRASLDELIGYLEGTMIRESGHPDGGRMYIDGALYHYRADVTSKDCLISNPAISIQKGSDSDLAGAARDGSSHIGQATRALLRRGRDEIWRWTDVEIRT